MMPYILTQTIIVPVIAAIVILLTRRILAKKAGFIAGIALLYTTALLCIMSIRLYQGTVISEGFEWGPYVSFGLLADGLSLPIALIINIICTALAFHSLRYMEQRVDILYGEEDEKTIINYYTAYFGLYLLVSAAFMGICFATNLIVLYLFIELLIIPFYLLISYFGYIERFRVAVMCFLWGIVGGTFVLFASVLVYSEIGSFEISELDALAGSPIAVWVALLIFIGLFIKMAVFPLHVWMPWVDGEAPTCIAASLTIYANLAAYVIVRVLILPLHDDLRVFSIPIMILALITIIYGALLAMAQTDVKRLCACSTIGQISFSVLGLGALTIWSIEGGLYYFLSHILGKAILFSTAGIVVYVTGIRDMKKMGGLIHKMPITATLWITAATILTGVPLTSGFTGKWILFTGVFGAYPSYVGQAIAILGILATILTAVYTFGAAKWIFFGPLKPELANDTKIRDPPLTMSIPLLILAVISIIIGLYPQPLMELFHSVIGSLI
uniref:F(420)H(2) dehydrogenase subunit M n=1 Tax=Candidatus Methanophaga sp. ANME-1 ERB7 TaxID=2759913 RepID=A0A7G9ZAD6_9EURY|nr:F(420)H(2) dehydrogenase subunit M [Methanosarcinales archaeon ANME-1 ERB7]